MKNITKIIYSLGFAFLILGSFSAVAEATIVSEDIVFPYSYHNMWTPGKNKDFDILKDASFYNILFKEKDVNISKLSSAEQGRYLSDAMTDAKVYIVNSGGVETPLPVKRVYRVGYLLNYIGVRVDSTEVRRSFPEGIYSIKVCLKNSCGTIKDLKLADIKPEEFNTLETFEGEPFNLGTGRALQYNVFVPFTDAFKDNYAIRPSSSQRIPEMAQVTIGQNGNTEYFPRALYPGGGLDGISHKFSLLDALYKNQFGQYVTGIYDLTICLGQDENQLGKDLAKDGYRSCITNKISLDNPTGTRVITATSQNFQQQANPFTPIFPTTPVVTP